MASPSMLGSDKSVAATTALPPVEASPSLPTQPRGVCAATPPYPSLHPTHCQNVSLLLSRSSSTPLPGLAEVTVHTAHEEGAMSA